MRENQLAKKKKKPVDPSRSLIVVGGGAAGLDGCGSGCQSRSFCYPSGAQ